MIAIVGGIQTGKTTKMMEYAKEHNCIVLTFSAIRARELQDQFKYDKVFPIQEYYQVRGIRLNGNIVIDDLELCLPYLFHRPVDMVTMKSQLCHLTYAPTGYWEHKLIEDVKE